MNMAQPLSASEEVHDTSTDDVVVSITVTDDSCSVDPCRLTITRGQTVSFKLDDSSANLKHVKVAVMGTGKLLWRHGRGHKSFELDPQDAGKGRWFKIDQKAEAGTHRYTVMATYTEGDSTEADCGAAKEDDGSGEMTSASTGSRSLPYMIVEE
jgi:hypothetical protein